jgi:hypothetical protein
MDIAHGMRALEPLEDTLVFAETGVHQRHCKRRYVPDAREIRQHLEEVSCLSGQSTCPEDVAPQPHWLAVTIG